MPIPDILKGLRHEARLTLEQLSAATAIGVSSLSEFETGKRDPSLSHLKSLSKVYNKPLSFFFSENPTSKPTMLWRDQPAAPQSQVIASQFALLCGQYRNLEVWTGQDLHSIFSRLLIADFPADYSEVEDLAREIYKRLGLGERPGESLQRTLEEVYGVKIFFMDLGRDTSSACTLSSSGPAILLNRDSRSWRRNFDLAHELFHLVTWNARKDGTSVPSEVEESYANCFASRLLLPDEPFRDAIEKSTRNGKLSADDLDGVSRQFAVSLDAVVYRINSLYWRKSQAEIRPMIEQVKTYSTLPPRGDNPAPALPNRYRALAIKALRAGEISSLKFAQYLSVSPSEALDYASANVPEPFEIPGSHC